MSKQMLPALTLRETRVRLLAWSFDDALTSGSQDGTGPDSHGSRLNLHGDLWPNGSYQELAAAIAHLTRDERRFLTRHYIGEPLHQHPKNSDELGKATALMPANVYVPLEITLAAGYLEGAAKIYRMPRGEQIRRHHRTQLRPKLSLPF